MKKNCFFTGWIFCILFISFSISLPLPAQNVPQGKVVRGQVKDPTGQPLQGVNILLKGTTKGTVTDKEGNFSVNAGNDDVLIISSIGFTTTEIPVKEQTTVNVKLDAETGSLSEAERK